MMHFEENMGNMKLILKLKNSIIAERSECQGVPKLREAQLDLFISFYVKMEVQKK